MDGQGFLRDAVELATERVNRGGLDRRTFLEALALVGLAPTVLMPGQAGAQTKPKEVVVANWGGPAVQAYVDAWGKPFEADSGVKVAIDGTGPLPGKIRAMVEAKNVIWDVADSGPANCLILGNGGFLDPFDYSVVDKSLVRPGLAYEWGITNYVFSYVLTYDTTKFGSNPPKSWKDFWNVQAFPGKRCMWKNIQGVLEVALMADGVPADAARLYPLDEKRALDMIRRIKDQTIFYTTGAQSMELMRSGECSMGMLWHTRTTVLHKEDKGRFDWTWNQGFLVPGTWLVPKGNPAGKAAYQFIRSTQIPERQVKLLIALGNGPANPAAAPLVPPEYRRYDPAYPDNAKQQVTMQPDWYYRNQERVSNLLFDLIAS